MWTVIDGRLAYVPPATQRIARTRLSLGTGYLPDTLSYIRHTLPEEKTP